MILVNLFGAPNSGKTTMALELSSRLKKQHIEVDYVPEPVKYAHYTNSIALLKDELLLFANKNHNLNVLEASNIEVAVTDGPLLNSLIYMPKDYYNGFVELVCSAHESHSNINIFIPGLKKFSKIGRSENPDEALNKGLSIKSMLDCSSMKYLNLENCSKNMSYVDYAFSYILNEIKDIHAMKSKHENFRKRMGSN